jgi:Tfp pilus assembly protein PilF
VQYVETAQLGYAESLSKQRRALERALALDPTLGVAHARLAMVYESMGEPQERVREGLETALALAPDDPLVLSLYAHHLVRAGDLAHFLTAMQRTVELDPYSLVYRQNLAIVYLMLNRLGEAEREIQQAITIHPSMADSLAPQIAQLRILQGRPEDTLALLGKLEERADQLSLRAMALNDLGDLAASEAALAELASLPGPYARLRQGEAETYVYEVDATRRTLAAIDEAGTAGPEAFRQAQIARDELLYSPFLAAADGFRTDTAGGLAAAGSRRPDSDP